MSKPFVLFYSTRCGHCTRFLSALQSHPVLSGVVALWNVDARPVPQVQYVPTVLEVQSQRTYAGNQAFQWLQSASQQMRAQPCVQAFDMTDMQGLGYSALAEGAAGTIQHQQQFANLQG